MTTLNEQSPIGFSTTIVSGTDNSPRNPPLLAVGPLAWIKRNLFNTVGDTILTIVVLLIVGALAVSFVSWTVGQANWYAINFNLRLLMLGQYEPAAEWRVSIVVLLTTFTIGVALAAWLRLQFAHAAIMAIIVVLALVIPPVVTAVIPLPVYYASVGTVKIGGDSGQAPQGQVAFLGRANETITVRLAKQFDSDETLSQLQSFADAAANAAMNAAGTRLTTSARIEELNRLLASDTLTPNQRTRAEGELKRLKVADPVVGALKLNQSPVKVSILQGSTMQAIPNGTVTLSDADTVLTVTLPEDGWYVLQKSVDDAASVALLEIKGIYPVLLRNTSRGAEDNNAAVGNVSQYIRIIDSYATEVAVPADKDGKALPFVVVTSNGYRNTATFSDYLRLYVAPFLKQINIFLLVVFAVGLLGYFVAQLLDRRFSPAMRRRATSSRLATWLLVVVPVISFILIYGLTDSTGFLPLTDTRRWGGVLLTMMLTIVGIIGSLPLGILLALGRRSKMPVVSIVSTIYIELLRGIPFITVLFMAQLLIPLINPALSSFPGAFRAMIATVLFSAAYNAEVVRGGLQAIPSGQDEAAKALGLNGLQVTFFITLPQALRLVIPPMMGNFVGMFKDTSLVAIVGLLDLTGMAQNIVAQTEFLGLRRETFAFIAIFYFIFSYIMAAISRRIESTGAGQAIKTQI
jgi:His/Glu/Gln/Arg/opine family amino acid ABC transporter permease subunit